MRQDTFNQISARLRAEIDAQHRRIAQLEQAKRDREDAERRRVRQLEEAQRKAEADRIAALRAAEDYRADYSKTVGIFERYENGDAERRAIIEAAIETLMPRLTGDEDDRNPPPRYSALSTDAKWLTLGAFLGIDAARDQYPRLRLQPDDWARGGYVFEHRGPADLSLWRSHVPKIRDHIDADAPVKGDFSVQQFYDASHVLVIRDDPLPDKITFDPALLRRGEVYFGLDLVTRQPVHVPIVDLTHMLVCGLNGEGKSNLLNAVLLSLLFNADLLDGLTLVDLKGGLELARYPRLNQHLHGDKITFVDHVDQLPELCGRLRGVMDRRIADLRAKGEVRATNGFHFVIIDEFAPIQLLDRGKGKSATNVHADLLLLVAQGRAPGLRLWAQVQQPVDAMMSTAFRSQLNSVIAFKVPAINAGIVFDGATDFPVRPSDLPPHQFILALRGQPKRLVKAPYIPPDLDLAAIVALGQQATADQQDREPTP